MEIERPQRRMSDLPLISASEADEAIAHFSCAIEATDTVGQSHNRNARMTPTDSRSGPCCLRITEAHFVTSSHVLNSKSQLRTQLAFWLDADSKFWPLWVLGRVLVLSHTRRQDRLFTRPPARQLSLRRAACPSPALAHETTASAILGPSLSGPFDAGFSHHSEWHVSPFRACSCSCPARFCRTR